MKNLYNIVEGILDIDDKKLDDISDDIYNSLTDDLRKTVEDSDITVYCKDKFKEITLLGGPNSEIFFRFGRIPIKLDKIYITNTSSSYEDLIDFSEYKSWKIKANSNITVGFVPGRNPKLSDLNLIGKNHWIKIYPICTGWKSEKCYNKEIIDFFDTNIDPSTSLILSGGTLDMLQNPVFSKFNNVRINLDSEQNTMFSAIKNLKTKKLTINGVDFFPGLGIIGKYDNNVSWDEIFDREIKQKKIDPNEIEFITNEIKEFLKNNPNTELHLTKFVYFKNKRNTKGHFYLKNGKLKYEKENYEEFI